MNYGQSLVAITGRGRMGWEGKRDEFDVMGLNGIGDDAMLCDAFHCDAHMKSHPNLMELHRVATHHVIANAIAIAIATANAIAIAIDIDIPSYPIPWQWRWR